MNINQVNVLEKLLSEFNIDKNDVVLVGSTVLAAEDIRENSDMEFILCPQEYRKLMKKLHRTIGLWGHCEVADRIDLFHNFGLPFGISDRRVFDNKLYEVYDGWNVLKIEYEYYYKLFLLKYLKKRSKDIADVEAIEERYSIKCNIKINGLFWVYLKCKDILVFLKYMLRDIYYKLRGKRF